MSEQTPHDEETPEVPDRGPGAHSGAERQAGHRTVRGTASATEGYRPDEGTAAGEALKGVEKDEDDDAPPEQP
ncbi:hypothetical protein [Streptomyces sp. NPDC006368]|uniref:hypothetical protein n=1 Tax=Streptomyces sp. NPDC006368 TaxID=3156760 RepID=UPI0033BC66AE